MSRLIGKTVRIENADNDLLNVVDVSTGVRYWIAIHDLFQEVPSEKRKLVAREK